MLSLRFLSIVTLVCWTQVIGFGKIDLYRMAGVREANRINREKKRSLGISNIDFFFVIHWGIANDHQNSVEFTTPRFRGYRGKGNSVDLIMQII